ncbi:MAG: aminotransferase class V-fold PLP-dependent enzyme, partial [Polyangiales bacterium]
AHKWLCGHIETGFMYVRPELLPRLAPAATGWMAGADPLSFEPPRALADGARRFATGTPAVLPALASRPGLDLVAFAGVEAIRAHSLALTARILERAERAGLGIRTPPDPARRGGTACLSFDGDRQVAAKLVERGFVCSHRGGLRIAPHFYNTDEEVDRFMDTLEDAQREA